MKTYLVVETPVVACLHAATSDGYLCSRCNVCDDMASWCDCVVDHDGVSFYFGLVMGGCIIGYILEREMTFCLFHALSDAVHSFFLNLNGR